jgi:hypothetical protein
MDDHLLYVLLGLVQRVLVHLVLKHSFFYVHCLIFLAWEIKTPEYMP